MGFMSKDEYTDYLKEIKGYKEKINILTDECWQNEAEKNKLKETIRKRNLLIKQLRVDLKNVYEAFRIFADVETTNDVKRIIENSKWKF